MLKFDRLITDIIDAQKSTRKTDFITYNKKQIMESGRLTEEQKKFIKDIKGTFSFALHTSGKYLIVTLVREKKYRHLVVDLRTMNYAEIEGIKYAKHAVRELINKEIAENKVEEK